MDGARTLGARSVAHVVAAPRSATIPAHARGFATTVSTSGGRRAHRFNGEKWVSEILEEKLREQRRRTKERLRPLAKKRKEGKLTWGDIDGAMRDVLCFGNLCWCCPISKKCGKRDTLLKAIGLTKNDYTNYKKACEGLLWLMLADKKVI